MLDEVRTVPVPQLSGVPVAGRAEGLSGARNGRRSRYVARRSPRAVVSAPEGFTIHPKLERQFAQRMALLESGEVDWAFGEALAIGSLVLAGSNVRLTGQDTRRGTFSHRHAALIDYENGTQYVPLASMGAPGFFTVRDSFLSEYAVLGFEYGYSVEAKNTLVAWEAQFGDFANGAEIIMDNFLVAAEDKWGQHASLVMLLPHGYEGQGPEHSSGRIERFLSLSARNNIRVAEPTTAAQYFHLLAQPGSARAPDTPHRLYAQIDAAGRGDTLAPERFRARLIPDSVLDDHVDGSRRGDARRLGVRKGRSRSAGPS